MSILIYGYFPPTDQLLQLSYYRFVWSTIDCSIFVSMQAILAIIGSDVEHAASIVMAGFSILVYRLEIYLICYRVYILLHDIDLPHQQCQLVTFSLSTECRFRYLLTIRQQNKQVYSSQLRDAVILTTLVTNQQTSQSAKSKANINQQMKSSNNQYHQ